MIHFSPEPEPFVRVERDIVRAGQEGQQRCDREHAGAQTKRCARTVAVEYDSSDASSQRDLNSKLPTGSKWVLSRATAINNLGQITGSGSPDGGPIAHAYRLTPR